MSNRTLMLLGALAAIVGAASTVIGTGAAGLPLAIMGGALFGKGYAYWETGEN